MALSEYEWMLVLATVLGACMIAAVYEGLREYVGLRRSNRLTADWKCESLWSLGQLLPNGLTTFLMAPVWASIYFSAEQFAVTSLPISGLSILLAFLAADLSYYWEHRCGHLLRFIWAAYHGVHHTSSRYGVAAAYRVSFVNHFLAAAFYLPWILLGLNPKLVLAMQLIVFHYQAWLHSSRIGRLGWLDNWFNTPANHRMHHSRDSRHRYCNFGAVLMIWDRIFGSYAAPETGVEFGIAGASPVRRWWQMYLQPFRR